MKVLNILRMFTFIVSLLSSIPLFIHYLSHSAPRNALITHVHVWFGLSFFVFAIISMILTKKQSKKAE